LLATLPILFGWLWTVGACYAAGAILLRYVNVDFYREETHFFRFITGSACFSLLVFALTAAHLAYTSVFLLAGAPIIALAAFSRAQNSTPVPLPDFSWIWKAIFLAVLAVFGIYYFLHALAPEISPDGATYHLGIVGRYLRQHSFGRITTDMYANLSEAIEMLFLAAYSIGKHSSAALVEFSFLLALPWGMLSYARRIGFPKAGVFGSLVAYASPVFGLSGTIAYNDAAGAAILFALFYLLQIWNTTRQHRLIPLIGLIAGFCYGAKYTLFLALPFAGLYLLWKLVRAREPFFRPLLLYSAAALLLVVPWMAKNWVTVRNPFSPFANRLFPNPYVTVHFEQEYSDLMRNREGLTLPERPLDHIALGAHTAGLVGPVFLLAPLALLALRFSAGRQLLLAACVFVLPAYTNVETRFLMPMVPFLALALGLVLTQVPAGIPIVLAFHFVTAWPGVIRSYSDLNPWALDKIFPAEAFRLIPESVTLRTRMPPIAIAELLDRQTPPDARIFTYSNPPEAYTSREIIVKYESALGNRLGDTLWTALLPDLQPTQILSFSFPIEPLRGLRVVQTASHQIDMWSISELRVMAGTTELPRQSTWDIRASVNSWELPFAWDRNLVTRWSTMEPIRPGMTLTLEFQHPQEISELLLEGAVEWSVHLRLEGERQPGQWQPLVNAPIRLPRLLPLDLRTKATAELKTNGITHILITGEDFGTSDFFTKQKDWNIEFIGEAQGSRLYRLL